MKPNRASTLIELSPEERRQVITLPSSIAKLTVVKHLVLYGSNLVRVPPEIGAMSGLEEFTPYTSYRLHWFPYEITRCRRLARSTVSTRALFGNFRLRPPFPKLTSSPDSLAGLDPERPDPGRWGPTALQGCSVCDGPIERGGLRQVWISLRVATDVLPLLVNACSPECVASLPGGARDHIPTLTEAAGSTSPRPTEASVEQPQFGLGYVSAVSALRLCALLRPRKTPHPARQGRRCSATGGPGAVGDRAKVRPSWSPRRCGRSRR
ncbi:leucine-rich repeat domain-containing protein [Streptomyces sp. NPDC015661]|uniref:leucine-rich repeat domain-containing protein n=1 Tax=Streptomyces sp. NPDC015661 TaxID=3364961 RepID=UPI0037024B8C